MKKIIFLLTFGFIFLLISNGVSAAEHKKSNYPTKMEIEALNQELQGLVEEANEKLANGEENIEVTSKNLKLGFKKDDFTKSTSSTKDNQLNSMVTAAVVGGSKSYQAYVANTTGFNFRHAVYGNFTWNGLGVLLGVTADEDLTGAVYGKSATTRIEGVDGTIGRTAKIARVTSKGTFTPAKYAPYSYYTTLIVDIYGPTQSYRIVTAKISV